GVADLLRMLGPLTAEEIAARSTSADVGGWLDELAAARRALRVSYAGRQWWVAVEDIGLLRDAVGVAVPVGVPTTFTGAVADPLGELLGRYARTRGPFTTAQAAVPGRAARPGRAGQHRRVRPVPAGLAAGGHRELRHRRAGRGDRAAGRCADAGLGGGVADPAAAGARLPAGDAR